MRTEQIATVRLATEFPWSESPASALFGPFRCARVHQDVPQQVCAVCRGDALPARVAALPLLG